MNRILKVAVGQTEIIENGYDKNLQNAVEFIEKASKKNADVICFPEFFTTGVLPKPEEEYGNTLKVMRECAQKNSIHIVAGTVVESRNGQLYNTSYIIDTNGDIISKYDKSHLYPLERNFRQAGNTMPQIFTINGIKAAVIICAEMLIPEVIRSLALNGVEVVFCPSFVEGWMGGNIAGEERRRFCLTRSAENQIYVIDVCGTGSTTFYQEEFGELALSGYSTIAGPGLLSELIAGGGNKQELLIADLNMGLISQKRNTIPILHSRRPEMYHDLTRFGN